MSYTEVCEKISSLIIKKLEEGTVPWKMPWKVSNGEMPRNLLSDKAYSGINFFLLLIFGSKYQSPYWLTYKQTRERGGFVKKAEKGLPVIYWNFVENIIEKEEGNVQLKKVPFLKTYTVFNVEQCEGVTYPDIKAVEELKFVPVEKAEKIIEAYKDKPKVSFGGNRACYSSSSDSIRLPEKKNFLGVEEFYASYFHELVHSTGHESRLSRDSMKTAAYLDKHEYSKEELVAEMGAAMLCGLSDIEAPIIDNSASYIEGWINSLKGDSRLLIYAGAQAQKAVEYMLSSDIDSF